VPVAALPTRLPLHFGPYELLECIGRGGMAEVFKGKRRGCAGFEKQVVVKTILPNLASDERFVRLFTEEALLSAKLLHNNIVRAHDFGFVGRRPFLELELLVGWNLKELWERVTARSERIPVAITLTLVTAICRGLAYAHSFVDEGGEHRPIIHRDVSPANVMICRDGSIKLLDFGLAQLTHGETLQIETFQGKLAYMSPEQMERRCLDRRADVFGLGAILHELLVGRRLFGVGDDAQTLRRLTDAEIEAPSTMNPEVPAALDVIALRALTRDPDERYQSAAEMLVALDELSGQAASPTHLLGYLGSIGPEMFTTACDLCGERLPWGVECGMCKTQIDEGDDVAAATVAPVAAPPPPVSAARSAPPRRPRAPIPPPTLPMWQMRAVGPRWLLALMLMLGLPLWAWARRTAPRIVHRWRSLRGWCGWRDWKQSIRSYYAGKR
jgi:serine/threonine protein kinase